MQHANSVANSEPEVTFSRQEQNVTSGLRFTTIKRCFRIPSIYSEISIWHSCEDHLNL